MPSKTFRFSLQSVADLRDREVEQAEQALARILHTCTEQQAVVEAAQARLDAVAQGMERARGQGLRAVRQQEAFRREGRRELAQAVQLLESYQRQAEQARRLLRLRRTAQESLGSLRHREQQRYAAELQRLENAQLDEQAISIYRRQQATS